MLRSTILLLALLTIVPVDGFAQASKKKKSTKTKKATPAAPAAPAPQEPAGIDKPDLNIRPAALPGTAFQFPSYGEFTLPNGLHVYVIENHEQPTVTMSLTIRGGDAYDPPGKEGTAAIAGDMLGKGTKGRTAQQIAEALDGVGASISVSTAGEAMTVNASSLKKHAPLLFAILSEELREPTFNEDELTKLKQQYQASIASRRSRSSELAQALSRKVIYGMDNPLARRSTEKTIAAVTREDVVAFHSNYIRPNSASLAVVGDVTEKEVREWLKKYFAPWEKGTRPEVQMPPIATEPAAVFFVPRKGSVQSTVIVCAAAPAVRAGDYDATDILARHIGSGFGSVLFNTLRETYSYTYSPFSLLTRGRRYNRIAFGAEVRSSVTDSAITVILREVQKLANEGPDEEALTRRVASEVGQYQLAFENASTVAAVLQNAWLNDVPINEVTSYTSRLSQITSGDVQTAANTYLGMFNLRLVVVGAPEVRSKLEQFGPIKEFTLDLEPAAEAPLEPVSMSVDQIVDGYVNAIGGKAAVDAVKNVTMKGDATMMMQGREMKGTFERVVAVPNKEVASIDLGLLKQQQWVNGTTAWVSMMNGPAGEQPKDETDKLVLDARIFPFVTLVADGYKVAVKGKRNGQIILEATSPYGRADRYVVDEATMLLVRIEKEEQTAQGPIVTTERLENYAVVSGVKMPGRITISNNIYSITINPSYTVNGEVSDTLFTPTKK
jgi:predicted Zn-dependent peptidase